MTSPLCLLPFLITLVRNYNSIYRNCSLHLSCPCCTLHRWMYYINVTAVSRLNHSQRKNVKCNSNQTSRLTAYSIFKIFIQHLTVWKQEHLQLYKLTCIRVHNASVIMLRYLQVLFTHMFSLHVKNSWEIREVIYKYFYSCSLQ